MCISSYFFEIQLFQAFRLRSLMSHWIFLMFDFEFFDFEETQCCNPLENCFNATVMADAITPKANITGFDTLYII